MRTFTVAALAAALVAAAAAPAAASSDSVLDRNVQWMLDALGLAELPEGDGSVHDHEGVRAMAAADVVRLAAARAGDVDLAALAAGASNEDGPWGAGDVWIVEIGPGWCPLSIEWTVPSPVPGTWFHPQATTYAGSLGHARTEHADGALFQGQIIDWTTKGAHGGAYADGDVEWWGQSDFWCGSPGFGFYLLFPYIDGYARHFD